MSIWKWLNNKRLRDYPRLVLISCSIILLLNLLLSHGWIGGLTGILMWGDFLVYYSAGILYKTNITQLYNLTIQEQNQRILIAPSMPPGVTFYSYPPGSAQIMSIFSSLPLPVSLMVWLIISIGCVILVLYLMNRFLIPKWFDSIGLSFFQLGILIFSSFAFIEGFATGQMHTLILLLVVAILYATVKEKWFLAGLLAAMLFIKPQLIIGFVILWLIWKKFYPILTLILFSLIWQASVLLTKGVQPYIDYLGFIKNMSYLPYIKEGFPIGILSTLYTFVASLISLRSAFLWNIVFIGIALVVISFFGWLIYKTRNLPMDRQNVVLAIAVLLPLIITPYALLHDLVILFPVMILLAIDRQGDKQILLLAVSVYISMLVLPLVSHISNIALTGLIPIAVFYYCIRRSIKLVRNIDIAEGYLIEAG